MTGKLSVFGGLVALGALLLVAGCDGGDSLDGGVDGGEGGGQFTSLYNGYFQRCVDCHSPDGPGRTAQTEQTLDFSSKDKAYSTITNGTASGLVGNQEGCNGVSFVGTGAGSSLIVAVVDQSTRNSFDLPGFAECDMDAISDMTVKAGGGPSAAFVSDLKSWIEAGTPND